MLVTTVLTQALVPAVIARIGSGPALASGLLLLGAPAPLYALSSHLSLLLAVSAVRGTGFALLTVIGATLTSAVAPPQRHGEAVGLYGLAIAVPNLVGIPAIAVPSGFSREGLPLSLQIMAPHFEERALFRAAAFFEGETGYWKRRP